MEIKKYNNKRILIKENLDIINISANEIIEYTGIFYKKNINLLYSYDEIETKFIGKIDCDRFRFDTGITGIYINPLLIWDIHSNEWLKIINYKFPSQKYFLYPHLIMLPNTYYHYKPLYFMDTCINKNINEYKHIYKYLCLEDFL